MCALAAVFMSRHGKMYKAVQLQAECQVTLTKRTFKKIDSAVNELEISAVGLLILDLMIHDTCLMSLFWGPQDPGPW